MAGVVEKQRQRRSHRVRARISGTSEKPRLSVHISNLHVSVQLIDDGAGRTMAQVTTIGQKSLGNNLSERAAWAGDQIAKQAKTAKISRVVFDRGGKLYHGRIKALAEAARAGGLKF